MFGIRFIRKNEKVVSKEKWQSILRRNKELYVKTTELDKKNALLEQKIKFINEKKSTAVPQQIPTPKYTEQKQILNVETPKQEKTPEEKLIEQVNTIKQKNIFNKKHVVQKITKYDEEMIGLLRNGKISYAEMSKLTNLKESKLRNRLSRLGTKIDIEAEELADTTKVFWIKKESIERLPLQLMK